MGYIKTIWKDLPDETTPLNSANLNKIENGIETLDIYIDELNRNFLSLKRIIPYDFPNEFTWADNPLKNHIFTDGEGNFATDFDVSILAPKGKKYYVDGVNGIDTNDGLTPETALQKIITAYNKSDVVEIMVASGHYGDAQGFNNTVIAKSISIKAIDGADVTISTKRGLGSAWVKTDGYTNVYNATRTLIKRVLDYTNVDINGDYIDLVLVGSVALVDSTPNSYYYSGGVIYAHTFDDRPADDEVTVYLDLRNLEVLGNKTVYLENIKLDGGKYCIRASSDVTGAPTILAKNCSFKYAFYDDGVSHYGANVIYQNCTFAKNLNDGISHNMYSSTPTKAIEIDCISRHNGVTEGNDNGSTSHDGCSVIRLKGAYYHNVGPNVADVGGSESVNIACTANDSKGSGDSSKKGFTSSTNNGITGNKVWLDSCVAFGNESDIYSDIDNFIYIRNTRYQKSNNAEIFY